MKKAFFTLAMVVFSNAATADSGGLKSLQCNPVLGSAYSLQISDSEVVLIESWVDTKASTSTLVRKQRHSFPVDSCTFEPFSINLECQDPDDKKVTLAVLLTRTAGKSKSHEIEFGLQGISGIQSKTFRTERIDMGKAARCIVNDTFEVL
jgi:hypothetical protein